MLNTMSETDRNMRSMVYVGYELESGLDKYRAEELFSNISGVEYISRDGSVQLVPYTITSCGECGGAEIQTEPFGDIRDAAECLFSIWGACSPADRMRFSPAYGAGTHINISWPDFDSEFPENFESFKALQSLLSVIGCKENSYLRDGTYFCEYVYYYDDTWEKFSSIHEKDYAIEFRMFDAMFNPYRVLCASAVIIAAINNLPLENTLDAYDEDVDSEIYHNIHHGRINRISEDDKEYIIDITEAFIKDCKETLIELSEQVNFDFLNAIPVAVEKSRIFGKRANFRKFMLQTVAVVVH